MSITTMQHVDQNVAYGTWESLPKDIMEAIAWNLNSTDYIIISSMICKSWQSLLLQSEVFSPQLWLLLPHQTNSQIIKFFNVLDNKFHTFVLPKGVDGGNLKVVGCSKGWVIFMAQHTFKISLFNPTSGIGCPLPLLPTTSLLQRVELSSPNVSDCTVAAIFDSFEKLALCRFGDESWEVFPLSSGRAVLIDILFCCQKLHTLIKSETCHGKVEIFTIKLPSNGKDISVIVIHDTNYKDNYTFKVNDVPPFFGFEIFARRCHISYLVESVIASQVLLIQKYYYSFFARQQAQVDIVQEFFYITNSDNDEEDYDNYYNNKEEANDTRLKHITSELDEFKVYEIEDSASNMRVCKGLGKEQALFLSSKSRLCFPSYASNNKLQENSIYFIMDRANVSDDHDSYLISINGVYDFDNSNLQPLKFEFHFLWNSDMVWFKPSF